MADDLTARRTLSAAQAEQADRLAERAHPVPARSHKPMPKAPEGYACCRTRSGSGVQISHLVVRRPAGGTPGPCLCGLTRFDQRDPVTYEIIRPADIPGWSINGGMHGPGIEQVKCVDCWAIGEPVSYEPAGSTASVEWRRGGAMGVTGATLVSTCSKCGALVADEVSHTRWHERAEAPPP